MLLSLMPFISLTALAADEEVYIYTPVEGHTGPWTSADTYGEYYLYVPADDAYYLVQPVSTEAMYDSTGTQGWSINSAVNNNPGKYYYTSNKTEFSQVVTTGFTRHLAFDSKLPSNMRDQSADLSGGFKSPKDYTDYGVNSHLYVEFNGHFFELYGQEDGYSGFTANEYGTDYWQGGYRQRMIYYPNGTGNAFSVLKMGHMQDGEDEVGSSWSFFGGDCNYYVGMDIYKGSGHYGLGYKTGGTANTRNTGSTLNLAATQFSQGTDTTFNSDTVIYTGPLYWNNNHSGVTRLSYVDKNGVTQYTSARTLIYGDTLYDGTLYTRELDKDHSPVTDNPTETDPGTGIDNPDGLSDAGFKLKKGLSDNGDGTYDINMQSYSTADTKKEGIVEKVPTDFVVIVDQSGSMADSDMATGYRSTSTKTLEQIVNGNYYYKSGDTYYRVYATRDYLMEYHAPETLWTKPIIEDAGMSLSWFQGSEDATFSQANQYYFKTTDGVYRPVHMTATGKVGTYYIQFDYTDASGKTVKFVRPSKPIYKNVFGSDNSKYGPSSFGYGTVNDLVLAAYPTTTAYTYSTFIGITTGMYVNYPMYTRHLGYSQLAYRDVNGVEHILPSDAGITKAEYCNSSDQALVTATGNTRMNYSGLYEATGYKSRLEALKGALTDFVTAVAAESDSKDGVDTTVAVDNRIAMVGFSSEGYRTTEIITGNNVRMSNATTADYKAALISANNGTVGTVNPALTTAINSLEAYGGTQPEYGFQMAKSVLDNRQNKKYTFTTGEREDETTDRNTIVIFFTDGQPGDYADSNQYSEANDVVEASLQLKNNDVKVFSIGVFGESDGNPLTYDASNDWATNQSGQRVRVRNLSTGEWKYLGGYMGTYNGHCLRRQWRPAGANAVDNYTDVANDTIFDYMSVVSSNYPDATTFIADDWIDPDETFNGDYTDATDGLRHKDTSADTNQFYRMAANQDTLVEAFKQSVSYASIQQQNTGVVSLDATSVFRDAVNTADFDVSNATYSVTWEPIKVDPTAVATTGSAIVHDDSRENVTPVVNQKVPDNGVIEYQGFDYGANFVSWNKTEGYRLIVTVHGIVPLKYNQTLYSNVDKVVDGKTIGGCGIYELGKNVPEYSVQSPTLLLELHEPTDANVEMGKRLSALNPEDGSYTITLDAYATGNFDSAAVKLDTGGYLMDVINLENLAVRSDLSEADVHVYTLKGTDDGNGNVTFEPDSNKVEITDQVEVSFSDVTDQQTGKTNRAVKVIGFDYAANFIGAPKLPNSAEGTARNQGKKLIVTIGGLVPIHPGNGQTSNTDAGVYNKKDGLVASAVSPTFDIGSDTAKTYVIDFNAPMTIATDAKSVAKMSGTNGEFSIVDGNVIYQLNGSINVGKLILSGVDQAFALAKPIGLDLPNREWSVLTTIPAGSVYYDDDLTATTTIVDGNPVTEIKNPISVGDGSGYNSAVSVSPATENTPAGQREFTFYGTGIDIYCSTTSNGGYIQAKLTKDGSAVPDYPNQTVKNYSVTERYNVPSVSFTGLEPGKYTVTLNILGSSNYKLDGVRVYNPINDQSQYTGDASAEKYATYINMRDALVNNVANTTFNDNQMDDDTVVGALFVDDSEKLDTFVTATEEQIAAGKDLKYFDAEGKEVSVDTEGAIAKIRAYKNDFDAYKANSPKHEIYLNKNQAIVFQLTEAAETAAESGNLWLGLSAPDKDKHSGTVTLKEGKTIDITSGVDMYYPIKSEMIGANGVVTLTNTGDNMISVTNLKITGNKTIYNASNNIANTPNRSMAKAMATAPASDDVIPMVFAPLTKRTVMLAANNGVDPEAVVEPDEPDDPSPTTEPEITPTVTPDPTPTPVVTPEPTPTPTPSSGNSFVKAVTNIVKSLLKSISRLFGR